MVRVSIHVPARGTTELKAGKNKPTQFHSTFPHGERLPVIFWISRKNTWFQSTFPHGERLLFTAANFACSCFNPRSRTGNDLRLKETCLYVCCFNPRSRTGNDQYAFAAGKRGVSFNPRSRTGNDCNFASFSAVLYGFNPRSRTGNDSGDGEQDDSAIQVSIHVPARGTTLGKICMSA